MPHLNDEELARLVEEEPSEEELRHLEHCTRCAEEVVALCEQTRALSELPDLQPPPRLATRLRSGLAIEGLLLGTRARQLSLIRAAASVALFAAGGLAGYLGRGAVGAPPGELVAAAPPAPATLAEAAQRLESAESAYAAALTAYSRLGGSPAPDPVSRLAALEGIVLTTRAALNDAPADPVINGYHLTALEQRDALLRQLDTGGEQEPEGEQVWY